MAAPDLLRLHALAAALLSLALGCVQDATVLRASAREDFEAGHTEDAIETMRRVVELTPDDAEAHYLLGVMALRTDRPEEAERELARASALAPRDARMLTAYGIALRDQKKWDAAEAALLRSLLLDPDASTLAALAELYHLSGDYEKCALRYEQFVWQFEQRDSETLSESERSALLGARIRKDECTAAAQAAARRKRR